MKNVSDAFKIKTKKVKQQNIKLTIIEETVAQEIRIVSDITYYNTPISILKESNQVVAKELKYSFEGKLFKTIMKQIEITVKNANEIKDKNVNFQYGLYIDDAFEYVDLGDYYIKDVEDDKNKEELVVTGYDKMINFMKTFKQSELQLSYPCTLLTLIQKICEVCGVELYSTDFFNASLEVDEDFFTAQQLTYRDVLEKIAQSTLTTVFIKDNKLYFHKLSEEVQEILDKSYLSDLVIKEKFGPVNALILGRGDVEDNIESKDDESIINNGRCEIRFDENELVEYKREQVIDSMFEKIKGLEYYSFECSEIGIMWLEPCDLIEVRDREDNSYKTIYLKAEITINTGIKGNIEADIIEETNTEYKVTTKEEKKTLKVERLAKKNEGLIQDLVQETSEHSEKISQVEQDVDSINQKVSSLTDYTRTAEGSNEIHLTETIAGKGYISSFTIKGDSENFIYLTPSDSLTPSDNLVPLGRKFNIICDKQNRSQVSDEAVIEEIILEEPLRSYSEVYDELNITNGVITVTRRIGVNTDLSMYILENEVIENIGNCVLTTFKDDTYIYIKEYYNLEYSAEYVISKDFVTTEILNSAINLNSQAIMLEVNKKVNEEEFGTKITENYKSVQIAWNQISQYLKIEGIEDKASLVIYNENNNMLMKLNQNGETFYDESGNELGSIGVIKSNDSDILAFSMPVDWENVDTSRSMAWGIVDPNGTFLPIFYLAGYYGAEDSEYGGELIVEGKLSAEELDIINNLNFEATAGINWSENKYIMPAIVLSSGSVNEWLTYKAPYGHEFFIGDTSIFSMNEENIQMNKPFFIPYASDGTGYQGYPMVGTNLDYKYYCTTADGVNLGFFINDTYVAAISDKRLKKDIKEIDDKFLDAINEVGIKQFKADNRNGQISFGIIAQELIATFEKYEINPNDYEILQKIKYKLNDDTEYYRIEYEQFFALKQLANDRKIKELERKDKEKDGLIQELIKRIEILEGGNR